MVGLNTLRKMEFRGDIERREGRYYIKVPRQLSKAFEEIWKDYLNGLTIDVRISSLIGGEGFKKSEANMRT